MAMKRLCLAALFLVAGVCAGSAATVDLVVTDGDQNKVRRGEFENDNGSVTFRFNFAIPAGDPIKDIHIRLLGGAKFGSPYFVNGAGGQFGATSSRFDGNKFDAVVVAPRFSGLDAQGNLIFNSLFVSGLVGVTGKSVSFNFTPTTTGVLVPTPLPGAVGLMLSGLAGVAMLRRSA